MFKVLLIVLIIACVKGMRRRRNPRRELERRIYHDASAHGIRIPRIGAIWFDLRTVYNRHAYASPMLRDEHDDLLQSMWSELRYAETYGEWRAILHKVRGAFNEPTAPTSPVSESIERLRRASNQWREARQEANSSAI